MANPKLAGSLSDHDYNLAAMQEACEDEDIEEMELQKEIGRPIGDHTPLPSPNPKKMKSKITEKQVSIENVYEVLLGFTKRCEERFDSLEKKLEAFEQRIEVNTQATQKNREEIDKLTTKVESLMKENKELKESCRESARYRRRWDLRILGLTEKDNENTRETVIGILTRVVPVSVEKLQLMVDTVHRLGKKDNAVSNKVPRPIIIQFSMRTARDEVWRKSKEARVCKELNIKFKEDFSKEDREARIKLWPKVQEARNNGKRAFLKEGYAIIDGKRIDL